MAFSYACSDPNFLDPTSETWNYESFISWKQDFCECSPYWFLFREGYKSAWPSLVRGRIYRTPRKGALVCVGILNQSTTTSIPSHPPGEFYFEEETVFSINYYRTSPCEMLLNFCPAIEMISKVWKTDTKSLRILHSSHIVPASLIEFASIQNPIVTALRYEACSATPSPNLMWFRWDETIRTFDEHTQNILGKKILCTKSRSRDWHVGLDQSLRANNWQQHFRLPTWTTNI